MSKNNGSDQTEHREHRKPRDKTASSEKSVASMTSTLSMPSMALYVSSIDEAFIHANDGYSLSNCVFKLAKALKCLKVPSDQVEEAVSWWHQTAKDAEIRALPFDTVMEAFIFAEDRIAFEMGSGPMDDVIAIAKDAVVPSFAMKYDTEETRLLVKVCQELQRRAGVEPFFMSIRVAGAAIGLSPSEANRKIHRLIRDGILELVNRGGREKGKRPLSSTFRYTPPITNEW